MSDNKFYDLLGINKNANPQEIKKAYKSMALKHHPDRNPNNREESEAKFKEIGRAYKVLSDEKLRQRYDQFGEQGIEEGSMAGGFNPFDIFSNIFGGGGSGFGNSGGGIGGLFGGFGHNQHSKPRKSKDVVMKLNVSLEDLYNGKKKTLRINKKEKCDECNGIGCVNPNDKVKCNICNGNGKIVQIRQLGPGMIQQIMKPCYNCKQTGKIISDENKCHKCRGEGLIDVKKQLEYYIQRGMRDGEKIIIHGEAPHEQGISEAGNLILIINQTGSQNGMIREGNNLVYKHEICLSEALCGFNMIIQHFDGRKIKLKSKHIINPNTVMKVDNEGMPIRNQDLCYGNLIVRFSINFPMSLSKERKKFIKRLLPKPQKQIWDVEINEGEDYEEKTLEPINEHYEYQPGNNQKGKPGFLGEEFEDDDEKIRSNPIECASQ